MRSNTPVTERKLALSFRLGLIAVLLALLGWLGAFLGWLAPYLAFRIFALGAVVGGLLSLIIGFISWLRSRRSGRSLVRKNELGIMIGSALVLGVVGLVAPHASAPPIHDLTTNPEDPPQFEKLLTLGENPQRDLTYPHGGPDVPEKQKSAYPDLQPITLPVTSVEAFTASQKAVAALGWTVVRASESERTIEAYETSNFFRFTDDVVIRVRETGKGSVVDLRSTSRVGVSDLGANAERIRRFERKLRELVK